MLMGRGSVSAKEQCRRWKYKCVQQGSFKGQTSMQNYTPVGVDAGRAKRPLKRHALPATMLGAGEYQTMVASSAHPHPFLAVGQPMLH